MVAVADDLSVHGADPIGGAYQAVIPVLERRHAVVNVRHGARAVSVSHNGLLIGGGGMSDADYDAVFSQITGEGEIFVSLRGHCDVFDLSLCSLLIVLELLNGWLHDILFRLRSLVYHIEVRSLKVNAEDLGALIAVLHNLRHIGDGVRQNFFALGDRGGQKACHTLGYDIFCPVA